MSLGSICATEKEVLISAKEMKQKYCENYSCCQDCPLYKMPCRSLGEFITSIQSITED